MRDPTPYSITSTTGGEVAIIIEDPVAISFVAIGSKDLLALARLCILALREVERRRHVTFRQLHTEVWRNDSV